MAQIFAFGRVEDDLILKRSQRDSTYACFGVTEQTGKGQSQYYQVWAWGDDTSRLARLGVRKGSQIWFTGTLQLTDCTTNHGKDRTKLLKVYLSGFGFVPGRPPKGIPTDPPNAPAATALPVQPPMEVLDGDREPLPE